MAKPKAKSKAEKDADLQRMLEAAATSNDLLDGGGIPAAPAPQPTTPVAAPALVPAATEPAAQIEQEGEKAGNVPAIEPTPIAGAVEAPALAAPVPSPVAALTPEPAQAQAPVVPTPQAPAAPVAESTPEPKPAAPALAAEAPSAAAPEKEPLTKPAPEPVASVEATADGESVSFNIASLFEKSAEKKTWVVRITEDHQEYLSLLGTVVGGGASIPDMVHNILSQFITAHDGELQKALQKKLRQRVGNRR